MEEIQIAAVNPTESATLQSISRQTFYDTFAPHNTEENMTRYLEEGFSLQKLDAELNNPGSAFYFARKNEQVIGYLKVNTGSSQTELQDAHALEIERIYVIQEYQGKKIGQLLYDHAISLARKQQAQYVWLGVWEHNTKAIRFYEKNGFIQFDKHVFRLGDDEQTDLMMKKTLDY
jgi:diamine N-acetyltransferase